jgi:CheY-like chemotaxis protein
MEVFRRTAEIAHDFNNVLTVINGQSEWILRRLPRGDKSRPGIEAIYRAGLRAAELARELLASSDLSESENDSAEARRRAGEAGPGRPMPGKHILIADDEPLVRAYVRRVLEKAGYEVTEAEDGREAVRQVGDGNVQLVITDLVMPDQEGLETIQILRRKAPDVAIVAISGAFHPEYLDAARKLGAVVALSKPLTAKELLQAVSQALETTRRT